MTKSIKNLVAEMDEETEKIYIEALFKKRLRRIEENIEKMDEATETDYLKELIKKRFIRLESKESEKSKT